MGKVCFGVDVGGTTIKMGLFTSEGDVLSKWEIPTRTENNGDKIIGDIADAVKAKISSEGINEEDVLGIGIGIPGPVDKNGCVHRAVNLNWGIVELEKDLSKLTGFKVKAGNDANVAALGELFKGGGKGYDDMVLVTLGTGIGGGIIVNGKMLVGYNGAGGEIGHIHLVDDEKEPCGCGNFGCFEQYGSATGITRLAKRRLEKDDKDSILRTGEVSAKTVFDAVKAGDEVAIEIAEEIGEYLGKGFSIISGICNPEAFVIGGGVSKAGPVLFDYIEKYYKKYVFHAGIETVFKLAELGNDAGIYGAAKLILE